MVAVRACPRCSETVMLGGGSTIQNEGFFESGSPLKYPREFQSGYHFDSTTPGSYEEDISVSVVMKSLGQQDKAAPSKSERTAFSN